MLFQKKTRQSCAEYLLYFKIIHANNLIATPIIAKIIPMTQNLIVTLYGGQPKASK